MERPRRSRPVRVESRLSRASMRHQSSDSQRGHTQRRTPCAATVISTAHQRSCDEKECLFPRGNPNSSIARRLMRFPLFNGSLLIRGRSSDLDSNAIERSPVHRHVQRGRFRNTKLSVPNGPQPNRAGMGGCSFTTNTASFLTDFPSYEQIS